jgi:hypothetical protein
MPRGRAAASISSMRRRLITTAACAAAMALVPAAAQAATISYQGTTLVYQAAPGERNNVIFGTDGGSNLTIGDNPAIQFPANCSQSDPEYPVYCPMPSAIRVSLGDQDDALSVFMDVPAMPIEVHGDAGKDLLRAENAQGGVAFDGGDGDDTLKASDHDDTLLGGAGNDEIDGYGGADHIEGGDGQDLLSPDTYADPAADYVDGGPGFDKIDDYTIPSDDYHPPVSLTMDGVANDGRPGESDDLLNIEKIESHVSGTFSGGPGADEFTVYANLDEGNSTLIGNGGPDKLTAGDYADTLDGGAGDDVLTGGLGNDTITGGPGRDTIHGDATGSTCGIYDCTVPFGNDVIYARDGEPDTIDCGVGTDRAVVDAVDVVANCESVETPSGGAKGGPGTTGSAPGKHARLTIASTRLRKVAAKGLPVAVACAGPCRVTGTLRLNGRAIGSGRAKAAHAGTVRLTLKVRKPARRRLAHLRRATLKVSVTVKPAKGAATTVTRTVHLKR